MGKKQSLWKVYEKYFNSEEKSKFSRTVSYYKVSDDKKFIEQGSHDNWLIVDANNVSFPISFYHGAHEALGESYSREFFLALYLSGYVSLISILALV